MRLRNGLAWALMLALAAFLFGPCVAGADEPFGRTVSVPPPPAEIEPGKIDSAGFGLRPLQDLTLRPDADTPSILAEQGGDLDAIHPAYLMERGRRVAKTDRAEGAYLLWLGFFRLQYDARQCVDSSSAGYVHQIVDLLNQQPGWAPLMEDRVLKLAAYRRLSTDGRVFSSRVSAWYMCQRGMSSMTMGIGAMAGAGGPQQRLALSEWRLPEEALRKVREDLNARWPAWIAELEAAPARP